jgi:hypothetical protein
MCAMKMGEFEITRVDHAVQVRTESAVVATIDAYILDSDLPFCRAGATRQRRQHIGTTRD